MMAHRMSAAERQRKHRAKLRHNVVAYEEHLEWDRERKALARLNMDARELARLRKKGSAATRRWRHKQSLNEEQESSQEEFPYNTVSAFKKARTKVEKALPNNTKKIKVVLGNLTKQYRVNVNRVPSKGSSGISPDIVEKVVNFYHDTEISRIMPGKSDTIVIRDPKTKERCTYQKRHLYMTVMEAYELFCERYTDVKIGKSKFAELRPKYILLSSDMPHNICGCKYHNNIIMLLDGLHRKCPDLLPLYSRKDFLPLCVCREDEQCMSGECTICADGKLFEEKIIKVLTQEQKSLFVRWYKWTEEYGYLTKAQQNTSVGEALTNLKGLLPTFLWHSFIKEEQAKLYVEHKNEARSQSSNSVLLQMDFAENFKAVIQNEIQSAHWAQRQITVYTVMIWHREQTVSQVMVSDVRAHEKRSVVAYTSLILEEILQDFPNVDTVYIWTDGPSSQFKNRYIFSILPSLAKEFGMQLVWNYFATSHGKGPNDALGGTVKRMVHRKIMTEDIVVKGAADFQKTVNGFKDSAIRASLVTQENIEERCHAVKADWVWRAPVDITGVNNIHQVALDEDNSDAIVCKFYGGAETARKFEVTQGHLRKTRSVVHTESREAEAVQNTRACNINKPTMNTSSASMELDVSAPLPKRMFYGTNRVKPQWAQHE